MVLVGYQPVEVEGDRLMPKRLCRIDGKTSHHQKVGHRIGNSISWIFSIDESERVVLQYKNKEFWSSSQVFSQYFHIFLQ